MIRYDQSTLAQYLEKLAAREPVPGGGSVAALSGALGVALIEMVAQYSLGKGRPQPIEKKLAAILQQSSALRLRLLDLVSQDSEVYLAMREAKKVSPSVYKAAMKKAAAVPREIKALCKGALKNAPYLRKNGNSYLLSDVTAAEAFLRAAIDASQAMIETNE